MYLEQRRQLYYAVLTIPKHIRPILRKNRFIRSTGTSDKLKAQLIAYQYVAGWKLLISQAEGSNSTQLDTATEWLKTLKPSQETHSINTINTTDRTPYTPLESSFNTWCKQLDLAPKTIDQMTRDVTLLVNHFVNLECITPEAVVDWLDVLKGSGKGYSARFRIIKGCKNYWKFLKRRKLVSTDLQPFSNLEIKPRSKPKGKPKANSPYTPEQISVLWNGALNQTRYGKPYKDQQLADLIMICAYTGNRIEEICALKIINVTDTTFKFVESKTEAGVREVPIHSKLIPIVKRLIEQSTDEYLLCGLSFDQYNKRAGAIGKRFGILKTKLGFSSRVHTAHSFRSTLVTQLENAGVPEGVTADIVGHEKKTITYGLYSGGVTFRVMRDAIERVLY